MICAKQDCGERRTADSLYCIGHQLEEALRNPAIRMTAMRRAISTSNFRWIRRHIKPTTPARERLLELINLYEAMDRGRRSDDVQ